MHKCAFCRRSQPPLWVQHCSQQLPACSVTDIQQLDCSAPAVISLAEVACRHHVTLEGGLQQPASSIMSIRGREANIPAGGPVAAAPRLQALQVASACKQRLCSMAQSLSPLQGGAVDAAWLTERHKAEVGQQQASCIDVICNAKVASLQSCPGACLPGPLPQVVCQLLPAQHSLQPLQRCCRLMAAPAAMQTAGKVGQGAARLKVRLCSLRIVRCDGALVPDLSEGGPAIQSFVAAPRDAIIIYH